MDVVKQWTLNICLTLIGAVILSLVSPRGSMGRFYKTVLSLFIIAGFLLPITGGEKADFSAYFSDVTAQAADANSVYESQIESRVKQTLTAAGYKVAVCRLRYGSKTRRSIFKSWWSLCPATWIGRQWRRFLRHSWDCSRW